MSNKQKAMLCLYGAIICGTFVVASLFRQYGGAL